MIRSLLLAAGFLIVTIALLFLQPSPRNALSDDSVELAPVTRAEVGPSQSLQVTPPLNEPVVTAPEATPEPIAPVVVAAPEPQAVPTVPQSFEPAPVDSSDRLAMMTQNILRELRSPSTTSQNAPTPVRTAPATAPAPITVQSRLIQAHSAGLSEFELEDILREALAKGELEAAPAHLTASGTVDHTALIASLVPARVTVPSVAANQSFMYRVQPTDSLAGLAMLFYGDASTYGRIIAANAGVLNDASSLSPGMLIQIPGL
ncbi:LysM peptidoglycan-binding domain-containing protein [Roseobacteraceae bacterium S113]